MSQVILALPLSAAEIGHFKAVALVDGLGIEKWAHSALKACGRPGARSLIRAELAEATTPDQDVVRLEHIAEPGIPSAR